MYKEGQKVPVKLWDKFVPMDEGVYGQSFNMASLPFIFKHIALMPDAHFGKGSTVGSVIPTRGVIIPATVGVDLGCGMCAARTSLKASQLPDNLKPLYDNLCRDIPVGQNQHKTHHGDKVGASMWNDWYNIEAKHDKMIAGKDKRNWLYQIGTLGGGNHFIELCIDENQDVWLMLHSGSRGIGNQIGSYFINIAKEEMKKHFINLLDQDLAYLPEGTQHFKDYMEAVDWAQEYAMINRQEMVDIALKTMSRYLPEFTITQEAVNCHHNYVSRENHFGENVWVTRKGAIRARKDELGIIPGSMGTKSFIVSGLGNPESFTSCSHGAGRVMSRGEANKRISVEDHVKATEGIVCRKDSGVLDESPKAYKDVEAVMQSQSDLVSIVHTLRQVMCIKG